MKFDLGTHFRDKHGHLFLWDMELFLPLFKVGQAKVENMRFCRLSHNLVLKVDLGTHLRDNHGHLFLWDLELFWLSFKVGQTKVQNFTFAYFLGFEFWKWIYLPNWEISIDTYFYDIWSYFFPCSTFVKPRLKICTFLYFVGIEILKYI